MPSKLTLVWRWQDDVLRMENHSSGSINSTSSKMIATNDIALARARPESRIKVLDLKSLHRGDGKSCQIADVRPGRTLFILGRLRVPPTPRSSRPRPQSGARSLKG